MAERQFELAVLMIWLDINQVKILINALKLFLAFLWSKIKLFYWKTYPTFWIGFHGNIICNCKCVVLVICCDKYCINSMQKKKKKRKGSLIILKFTIETLDISSNVTNLAYFFEGWTLLRCWRDLNGRHWQQFWRLLLTRLIGTYINLMNLLSEMLKHDPWLIQFMIPIEIHDLLAHAPKWEPKAWFGLHQFLRRSRTHNYEDKEKRMRRRPRAMWRLEHPTQEILKTRKLAC